MTDIPTTCRTSDGTPLLLEGVQARGRLAGRLLDMVLEQHYRNPQDVNVEVIYTFPLPWQAVLLGLEVTLNGETLIGVVKPKVTAQADYDDAVADGNSAVLLTVNPDGSHTLTLGNLSPHETCTVRLHYVQVLPHQQGSLRVLLPATLAPRYGDPVDDGGFDPHAVPAIDPNAAYPFDIRLTLEGELARAAIASPSHPIAVRTRPSGKSRVVDVSLARQAWLDRDFVLVLDGIESISLGLLAWDRFDTDTAVVMSHFSPALPEASTKPVTLKVLIDCSGSMQGSSIDASRRALQRLLDDLREGDRFSLSRFGSTVEHRSRGLWPVTAATRASARRWVQALQADLGGTELGNALHATLRLGAAGDLLLITDGQVHAIEDVIATARLSAQRCFVVGIGASVCEGLLRRLALATGGACEFVAPGEAVEPAVLRLYQRMRAPHVSDIRLAWPEGVVAEATTALPKAIYPGDDITLYAWVRTADLDALQRPLRLYGRIESRPDEQLLAECTPREWYDEANTLARMAVHAHCGERDRDADRPAPDVLARAVRYQLLMADTALILVHHRRDGERATEMPLPRHVAGMLAAGWGGWQDMRSHIWRCAARSVTERPSTGMDRRGGYGDVDIPDFLRPNNTSHHSSSDALRKALHKALRNTLRDKQPPLRPPYWSDGAPKNLTANSACGGPVTVVWPAYAGLTPIGLLVWLRHHPEHKPSTYDGLRAIGVPTAIVDWLADVIGAPWSEADVVTAFLDAVEQCAGDWALGTTARRTRRGRPADAPPAALLRAMRAALSEMTDTKWPAAVLEPAHSA